MVSEKKEKHEVRYSKGHPNSRCGICEHFEKSDACKLVKGDIDPMYWCILFEKAK